MAVAAGQNTGADDAVIDTSTGTPVPVSLDTQTATIAANRDYATPVYAALRADRPFLAASSGYVGTASDGLAQLDADHRLATSFGQAAQGNVVQTAQLDISRGKDATLALGFGSTQNAAVATAGASASANPDKVLDSYQRGWKDYDRRLTPPASRGLTNSQRQQLESTYYLSANVLKASEDKTYPGAVVASLASPWGQAVSAGDPENTYFGSYREVFARDLYESFTGLVATGDMATARDTVRFLFNKQQQPDGSMPRNSLINGKLAPDSFGVQLDEVAYPILMARTVGLTDRSFYTQHIKRAADYVVAHGPSFGSERWEEQSGYSPSTIAAEIAGLAAAGAIADRNHDQAGARIYRATADHYQRMIKNWTVTTTGPLSADPYFIRLSKTGDPNAASPYSLGNGGPDGVDQRAVIDAGFLELARLGVLPANDPDIARSLTLVDSVIGKTTSTGQGYYRYGVNTPGTEDGYGDCNVGDPTNCTVQGKPWAGACGDQQQNQGSGHLWPVLAGERAEHEVATGDRSTALDLWRSMAGTASGIGLIPEQAWEDDPLAASPFGTQPECASIGFQNGKAAGSASPLTWSAAQFVRLSADIRAGRITELPQDTSRRYLGRNQAGTTVTITAPENNTAVPNTPLTITGITDPRATVDVDAVNTDGNGAAVTATTKAAADGSFSAVLTPPAGTVTITVVATTRNGATAFAQSTVVNDVVPGTKLVDLVDPTGDDNGPGTYAYPTAADFHPGAYDLQNFQIYDNGDDVIFRVQTANLSPTFGSPLGAQLIDVYANNRSDEATSQAASFPGRNYTLATPWNRLIEVQGFGQRFVDGSGTTVGSVAIKASEVTRYITFTVPKAALGGTPGSGWSFAVVLTGQDGFEPSQARGFSQPAQGFQFGVCTDAAVAADNPLCAVPPATVPRAVDVLTPEWSRRGTELNPLNGSVVIASVTIP